MDELSQNARANVGDIAKSVMNKALVEFGQQQHAAIAVQLADFQAQMMAQTGIASHLRLFRSIVNLLKALGLAI